MSLVASATSGLSSFFGRCTTARGRPPLQRAEPEHRGLLAKNACSDAQELGAQPPDSSCGLSRGATPGGVFAYRDWALAYSGAGDADRVGRATLRRGDRRGVVKRTAPRAYRRPEGREKGYPSPEKEVDTLFTFPPAGIGRVDWSEARAGSAAAARTAAPGASAPATASAAK